CATPSSRSAAVVASSWPTAARCRTTSPTTSCGWAARSWTGCRSRRGRSAGRPYNRSVDAPVERSVDELIAEAEEAAAGRIPAGQFVASLDWSLPRISQRGGDYAAQSTLMIADGLDRLGASGADLTPTAARALAAAAAVAAREGHSPESVGKV